MILFIYAGIFGILATAAGTSLEIGSAEASAVLIVLACGFGFAVLLYFVTVALHFVLAWKLETPKRWVWIAQVVILFLQIFNIYFLPLNIYFIIQLFKEEYKNYYNQK